MNYSHTHTGRGVPNLGLVSVRITFLIVRVRTCDLSVCLFCRPRLPGIQSVCQSVSQSINLSASLSSQVKSSQSVGEDVSAAADFGGGVGVAGRCLTAKDFFS